MSNKNDLKNVNAIKFANEETGTQNRLKSKVVWLSITSTILVLLGHLGLYEKFGITQESLQIGIDGILNILVLFGILNNPSDSKGF